MNSLKITMVMTYKNSYYSYAKEKIFKIVLNYMFKISNKNKLSTPRNKIYMTRYMCVTKIVNEINN